MGQKKNSVPVSRRWENLEQVDDILKLPVYMLGCDAEWNLVKSSCFSVAVSCLKPLAYPLLYGVDDEDSV